jgi:hypothetical protein
MWWPVVTELDVTLTKFGVVSERVLLEVDTYIIDIIRMNVADWKTQPHRDRSAEVVEDILHEYAKSEHTVEENSVRVRCSGVRDIEKGQDVQRVTLDVSYQQRNCLKRTRLVYKFTVKS